MTPKPATPKVQLPPPLIYLAFILAGIGIGRLINEPSLALPDMAQRGITIVLVLAGLVLDGWGSGQLRAQRAKPSLVTTGAYGFSRNPSYLGFGLIYFGFGIVMDSPTVLVLTIPCIIIIDRFIIPREEARLSSQFGAAYDAYRQKVRRWL